MSRYIVVEQDPVITRFGHRRRRTFALIMVLSVIFLVLATASVLAASLAINDGSDIEFGQGNLRAITVETRN